MTVIYSKKTTGCEYQVRTAGNSVRLYSNRVLHSQYNPLHPISGAIWDLLLLPAFLINTPPKNILLLGLGGGTLVHLIRLFFPSAHITCVDIDKEHIKIAKRFFKIPKHNVTVIKGDAYSVLKASKQDYDWIIDDVFQHVSGEPERSSDVFTLLKTYQSNLTKSGLLSLNLIGKRQLEDMQPLMQGFTQVVMFSHPLYQNKIVALLNEPRVNGSSTSSVPAIKKGFKSQIMKFKALDQSRKTCRLNYKLRILKLEKSGIKLYLNNT
jgi:spermidine synthase